MIKYNIMICSSCPNFGKLKIVPPNSCVSCYNLEKYKTGEPYVCNYCEMTTLRVHNQIACDSCDMLFDLSLKYKIPIIDLKKQNLYNQTLNELKLKFFTSHLEKFKKNKEETFLEIYNRLTDEQKEELKI